MSVAFSLAANLLCLRALLQDRRRLQNVVFFAIGTAITVFTAPIYLAYLYPEQPEVTTLFNRVSVAFTAVVTSLLCYFAWIFPTVRLARRGRTFAAIMAPAVAVLLLAPWSEWFVVSMVVREAAGRLVMERQVGPLYTLFYAPLVVGYMGGAIAGYVVQYRRATTRVERKQLGYTAISTGGGGLAATLTCIVLPLLGHPEYYMLGPALGTPIFALIMVYNIRTFKAMDIDQLLSASMLWGLSVIVSVLPFALFTYVLLGYSERFTVASGTAFMMLGLVLVYLYHRVVQPRIDHLLQRKAHDYRQLVQQFTSRLSKLTGLQNLLATVTDLLRQTLQPRSISYLLQGNARGEYLVLTDTAAPAEHGTLTLSSGRTRYIVEHAEVLEREQLEVNPVYAPDVREAGKRYLKVFDAEISVPLVFEDRLIGAINLGPRREGYYGRLEIEFLEHLRGSLNVALSNSMLLKDIEKINNAYARFVPREILGYLGAESIVDVGLGDHTEVEMSVLFADIRSFTRLSEQMSPSENFRFINAYLHHIGPVVRQHNGFIDKYIGDAVMALFPAGPDDALRAARAMLRALDTFNAEEAAVAPISIGIGVHTGLLMLGTIGEARRMEATVIADAVNLASRLEGLTKEYGVHIITSGQTLARVSDCTMFPHRSLGTVKVKGKLEAVEIFEVFKEPNPIGITEGA